MTLHEIIQAFYSLGVLCGEDEIKSPGLAHIKMLMFKGLQSWTQDEYEIMRKSCEINNVKT